MRIKYIEPIGLCSGVKSSLQIARDALLEHEKVWCVGDLVHNEKIMDELRKIGLICVNDIEDIPTGSIFLVRAHGISSRKLRAAQQRGIIPVDTTCPFVKRMQETARNFVKGGYKVLIIGKPGHPEVEAVREDFPSQVEIISIDKDYSNNHEKIAIICQTTINESMFLSISDKILHKNEIYASLNKTTCIDAEKRQYSVKKTAKDCDTVLVVGGKKSSNTATLAEFAKEGCLKTFLIHDVSDLKAHMFADTKIVGIAGGASTPLELIKEVVKALG